MQVKQFYKNGHAVKNHFLIIDEDNISFQSYDDIICTINHNKRIIDIIPDYNKSKTTLKNLLAFLSDQFNFYFDVETIENILKNQNKLIDKQENI